MQEVQAQSSQTPTRPPVWPKAIIASVMLLTAMAWLCVWGGWLSLDWGFWALSSGALAATITTLLWRGLFT
jgi:hypothetical protein